MQLLVFIFGMLFVAYLMPMIDAFSTWVVNLFNVKIVQMQADCERIKGEDRVETGNVNAIGFQYENNEEEWEGDDDE